MADEQKKQEIIALARVLFAMDYYQTLKVDRKAPLQEVKKAFFRESQAYHPDRFYSSTDIELKDAVMTVYKRIAEAYAVVRDPELRVKYDAQLAASAASAAAGGAVPAAAARLDRREAPAVQADPKAKNPQAQKYLQMGLMALRKGDFAAAELNLKFASNFEPGNDGILKKLKEAQERAKGAKDGKDPHKLGG